MRVAASLLREGDIPTDGRLFRWTNLYPLIVGRLTVRDGHVRWWQRPPFSYADPVDIPLADLIEVRAVRRGFETAWAFTTPSATHVFTVYRSGRLRRALERAGIVVKELE